MILTIADKCQFVHVRKTGGTWCEAAILAHVKDPVVVDGRSKHPPLSKVPEWPPRIAFTRHPISWYGSMWAFRRKQGVVGVEGFREWLEAQVEQDPTFYQRGVRRHLGDLRFTDFLGKYETLADDLCAALTQYEVSFDEDGIRALPPKLAASPEALAEREAGWTPKLKRRVIELEDASIRGWYRDGIP